MKSVIKALAIGLVAAACIAPATAQAGSLTWTKDTAADKVMSKAKKAGKPVFMICGHKRVRPR